MSAHSRKTRIDPARYPALQAFFGGYLHQDVLVEHGTAGAAARAFRTDARADERERVREEWRQLARETQGWSLPKLRRALTDLGAAWIPASRDEVAALFDNAS